MGAYLIDPHTQRRLKWLPALMCSEHDHRYVALEQFLHDRLEFGVAQTEGAMHLPSGHRPKVPCTFHPCTFHPAAADQFFDEATASLRELTTNHPKITAFRSNLAELCFDRVHFARTGDGSVSEADGAKMTQLMAEGVTLYRGLIEERGAVSLLRDIKAHIDSPACLEHELFRQLIMDLQSPAAGAETESGSADHSCGRSSDVISH